jgi:hypothetical protein
VPQRRLGRIAEHQAVGQVPVEVAVVGGLEGGDRLDVLRCPGERARVDSAMFYLTGTFYPLVARATYPTLGFSRTRAKWPRRTPTTT